MQILLAAVHTLSSIRLEEFSFQSRLFRSVTSTETPEIYANYTARRKKKQEKSSMQKCYQFVPQTCHWCDAKEHSTANLDFSRRKTDIS